MTLIKYLEGQELSDNEYCQIINEDFCTNVESMVTNENFQTEIIPQLKNLLFKVFSINNFDNNSVSFANLFKIKSNNTYYATIQLLGTYLNILVSRKNINNKFFINDSIINIYLQNIDCDFPELENFQRLELVMCIMSLDCKYSQSYSPINLLPNIKTFWSHLTNEDILCVLRFSPAKRIVFLDYLYQLMEEKIPENLINEGFNTPPNVHLNNDYYIKNPPFYFNFTYFQKFENKENSFIFLDLHKHFIFHELDDLIDSLDIIRTLVLKNYSYILLSTQKTNLEYQKFSFIYFCSLLKTYTYLMSEIKFSMIENIKPLKNMFLFEAQQCYSEIVYVLSFLNINILENMMYFIQNSRLPDDKNNHENIPYFLLNPCFEVDSYKLEFVTLINNAIFEKEIPINKY